jgi:hypothetical protein
MSLQRLVRKLVTKGWADDVIHTLLKGTDRAVIDREIEWARNELEKVDRGKLGQ